MLVLVVEDDKSIAEALCDVFISQGIKCIIAKNIEEALDALKKHNPNIIFLDLVLEGKIGTCLIEEARKLPNPPYIVVCSASNKAAKIAEEYKADYLLKKPFDLENIDEIINYNCT